MAIGLLGVVVLSSGALVWRSLQSTVTPYVVEVDESGAVRAVAQALAAYSPSDAQIAHHLAAFIEHLRSLSIDPVVVRQNWLKPYDFVTDKAAVTFNEYACNNDPFTDIGRKSLAVEMVSVVSASDGSF